MEEDVDISLDIVALFQGLEYGRPTFQKRVRSILKVGWINNVRRNPTMKGIILGNSCNKYLNFIADTGTLVAINPGSLAVRDK